MEKRSLGRTGFDVSVLGFGCAPAAYLDADQPAAARMIENLLDDGLNLLDTAISYPGSHQFLGKLLMHRRSDFVLVSKCGQKLPGLDGDAWSGPLVTQSVEKALQDLKTDHIDVMLIHSCDLATLKSSGGLEALARAREAGKIRFAGYSGDNEAAAWAAQHPEVAVIETSINIVDQRNIDVVLPVAQENNVGVIAKRPVANACWKDLSAQQGIYRNYVANYADRFVKMGLTPKDLAFEGNPLDVWPGIALRFTLGQPGVSTAIAGTTNSANAEANFKSATQGKLPDVVVRRIRKAFQNADPDGKWPGLT